MKKLFLLTFFLQYIVLFSQEDTKETENKSPIIFGELNHSFINNFSDDNRIGFGGSLNYQYKKSLFTVRYSHNSKLDLELLSPIIPFPILRNSGKQNEWGILYGRRWIFNQVSLSVSAGASINHSVYKFTDENFQAIKIEDNYIGVPFELNFKWFKGKKKRYRVLHGIIPVGKPTSFGRSVGVKIIGSISDQSYIGIGYTYGLGIHKKY